MAKAPSRFGISAALALAIGLWAGTARAEVIELLDKTKMNGKVIHFYDGVYTIEAGGQTMKLPKDKIKSISVHAAGAARRSSRRRRRRSTAGARR